MKQKTVFFLNLVLILVIALSSTFVISKFVFKRELDKTIKNLEDTSSGMVNFIDSKNQKKDKQSITGSISQNLNDKVWFVVNKKLASKNILDSIYFKDDFITPAVVVTNDGWLVSKKLLNTKNIALVNQENQVIDIDYIVNDNVLGVSYIKINKTGLSPIGIADSSSLEVGQNVYAIKPNLYNYQNEIIDNSIRNLHSRLIKDKNDLIHSQNDIVINGMLTTIVDAGLPVVNEDSEMIGITLNYNDNAYFLPSNYIRYSLTRLFNNDKNIDYPTLGISYVDLSEVVSSDSFASNGLYVYDSVNPLIKKADILTKINNDVLNGVRSLNAVLLDYAPGTEVNIVLLRDNKEQQIKVKLSTLKK